MSSTFSQLGFLALVSSALAVPRFDPYHWGGPNHEHRHHHHSHVHTPSGTGTGVPFPTANATGLYATTGTGSGYVASTGFVTSSFSAPVSAIETSASGSTTECTTDITVTSTEQVTVYVTASETSNSTSTGSDLVAPVTASSSSTRSTLTSHIKVTITVGGPSSSSEAAAESASLTYSAINHWHKHSSVVESSSSSSVEAAPTTTSTSVYVAPTTSSSSSVYVAPTTSSTSVYVAPTTSSTSIYVAPTTSSTSVYVAPTTSSVAASSVVSSAASAATATGKRGLAYNDASLTDCFTGSDQISWAYNWGSSTSGLSSSLSYVPLLWGTDSDFTDVWSANAQDALNSGSTHLMSFNEPDLDTQANLSPAAAAAAYTTYMMPFAGKAKLGAPAVTNGGGAMGLDWLSAFMGECSTCQIDFVAIHWYADASDTAYFKEQVQNASTITGGKPVWVTEIGATGSDTEITTFLEDVMPWMDSQDFVGAYSYFMVSDGLLVNSTTGEPSDYGSTFMSYTG